MIILFGFGITTEIKNSKIAIYDPSKDLATQNIVSKLETSEYFTLEAYLESPDQIEIGEDFRGRVWDAPCSGAPVRLDVHDGGHDLPQGWTARAFLEGKGGLE